MSDWGSHCRVPELHPQHTHLIMEVRQNNSACISELLNGNHLSSSHFITRAVHFLLYQAIITAQELCQRHFVVLCACWWLACQRLVWVQFRYLLYYLRDGVHLPQHTHSVHHQRRCSTLPVTLRHRSVCHSALSLPEGISFSQSLPQQCAMLTNSPTRPVFKFGPCAQHQIIQRKHTRVPRISDQEKDLGPVSWSVLNYIVHELYLNLYFKFQWYDSPHFCGRVYPLQVIHLNE